MVSPLRSISSRSTALCASDETPVSKMPPRTTMTMECLFISSSTKPKNANENSQMSLNRSPLDSQWLHFKLLLRDGTIERGPGKIGLAIEDGAPADAAVRRRERSAADPLVG